MKNLAEKRGLLNLDHEANPRKDPPFAFRELITPQVIENNLSDSSSRSSWKNWVNDHGTGTINRFRPESVQDLIDAVIWSARRRLKVRAVGSGHSHSKVAAPDTSFIQLSWNDSKEDMSGLIDTEADPNWVEHKWRNNNNPPSDYTLFQAQAGARIKYLNRGPLKDAGLGLLNMGSFDGQTLAGAINTSTHGTGARLGSLADTVRSVELMTVMRSPAQPERPIVRKFRIEPEPNGSTNAYPLTDRGSFEEDIGKHGTTLIQDDDVFRSVVVGYGCMGVAYSYTFETREKYFLSEDVQATNWNDLKNDIDTLWGPPDTSLTLFDAEGGFSPPFRTGARHFQFRVNLARVERPYPDSAVSDPESIRARRMDPECLLISHREPWKYKSRGSSKHERWPSAPVGSLGKWPVERQGKSFQAWLRKMKRKGLVGLPPKVTPRPAPTGITNRFNSADAVQGTASYIALRRKPEEEPHPEVDPEPPPPAISTEIAVPADQVVDAVEEVFEEVIENDYAYNLPMGVRFVAQGDHFLSPEYEGSTPTGNPIAKVEVPFLVRQYKSTQLAEAFITQEEMLTHAKEALGAIEKRLLDMSKEGGLRYARPHMGKTNHVNDDGFDTLGDMYDEFETWQAVHETFDGFGTFDNGFTEEMDINIDLEREQ